MEKPLIDRSRLAEQSVIVGGGPATEASLRTLAEWEER